MPNAMLKISKMFREIYKHNLLFLQKTSWLFLILQLHCGKNNFKNLKNLHCSIMTVSNSSCGKVMFSQTCVKNSVHREVVCMAGGMHGGGACIAGGCGRGACMSRGMCGRGACMAGGMPGRRGGHCSGRYASYWNAFLFWHSFIRVLRNAKILATIFVRDFHCASRSYQLEFKAAVATPKKLFGHLTFKLSFTVLCKF